MDSSFHKHFSHHTAFSQLYIAGKLRTNNCELLLSDLYQQFFNCSATERIFMIMSFRNSKGCQNDSCQCVCSLILMHIYMYTKSSVKFFWFSLVWFFAYCLPSIFISVSNLDSGVTNSLSITVFTSIILPHRQLIML